MNDINDTFMKDDTFMKEIYKCKYKIRLIDLLIIL